MVPVQHKMMSEWFCMWSEDKAAHVQGTKMFQVQGTRKRDRTTKTW